MNKVQSSYKGQDKGVEIETVNEVLNVNRRKSRINELDIKQIKLSKYSIFQNIKSMRFKNRPREIITRKNRLEDHDNPNLRRSIIKQKSKSINSLTKINNSGQEVFEDPEESNTRKSCNVFFDVCEISEKITTV